MGLFMTFPKLLRSVSVARVAALAVVVLTLAGCASEDVDDLTGSRMQPLPLGPDNKPPPPIEAGDVAIAGQLFSHDVRSLPQVASLTTPAMVRFNGVTSLVMDKNHQLAPIDTRPYTTLLRDRLLLGDREKLRFIERQLPPLTLPGKHHQQVVAPVESDNADYQVLAELRGRDDANTLRIQIEFVDIHSGTVLVNGIYRIRQEAAGSEDVGDMGSPPVAQPAPDVAPAPAPAVAPVYTGNGWTTPVPGINDNAAPQGQYNPPPPPQ